ncbi:hypothetical protein [Kangiella geojedonensis]|uniref:Lipoprotein n=1 Tax=Kangiella geojedonensis TaxID=914150 RepID=A0A0F6RCM7_9GAMM|nr:hypothetical protein [Kangiella geojedonensis]AKE52176.1 hypothetical protein TQ33_1217 [Kangiella geojedonensis]
MVRGFITCLLCFFTLGCSDAFLRAMDEVNAGMGGQRTCLKEADYEVDSYDGFSYKTGGLCNDWQGQIRNYSDYTIRCTNTINGSRANTIYAKPRATTELKYIGHMSGRLKYNCMKWAKRAEVWKDYHQRDYQILLKVDSGKNYISVKNLSPYSRKCFIKDKSEKVLVQSVIGNGQTLRWIKAPSGDFYTNCIVT